MLAPLTLQGRRRTLPGMHRTGNRGLLPLVATAAAALVALSACSTTVTGAPAPTASSSTSSGTWTDAHETAPLGVPAGAATATAPPAASGIPGARNLAVAADGLRPFLLTDADLGPGFVSAAEPRPDPSAPAVCGGPGVVAQFPDAVRVGVAFERPGGAVRVQEAVSVYADRATAQAAFDAGVRGLDCGQGTLGGRSVVVTPAEDLKADVGGGEATGWRIGAEGSDILVISVHSDEVVMVFTFVTPEGAPVGLPDPLVVTRGAVQKLVG